MPSPWSCHFFFLFFILRVLRVRGPLTVSMSLPLSLPLSSEARSIPLPFILFLFSPCSHITHPPSLPHRAIPPPSSIHGHRPCLFPPFSPSTLWSLLLLPARLPLSLALSRGRGLLPLEGGGGGRGGARGLEEGIEALLLHRTTGRLERREGGDGRREGGVRKMITLCFF